MRSRKFLILKASLLESRPFERVTEFQFAGARLADRLFRFRFILRQNEKMIRKVLAKIYLLFSMACGLREDARG